MLGGCSDLFGMYMLSLRPNGWNTEQLKGIMEARSILIWRSGVREKPAEENPGGDEGQGRER